MIWAAIASAIALAISANNSRSKGVLVTWLDAWRKYLRKYVKHEGRRAAATAIIDGEAADLETSLERINEDLYALYEVHRRYDATLAEHEPIIDAIAHHFGEIQHAHVAAVFELHATLSEQEWREIQARVGADADADWTRMQRQEAKRDKRQKHHKADKTD